MFLSGLFYWDWWNISGQMQNLRTGRVAGLNGILISAIRHKGIGKTFTALNLLKTFGIAFFSTAFLCDFFMDMIYGNAIQNYVFLSCLVSLLLMVYFYFRQSQLKMQISVLDTQYDLIESQYVRAQNFIQKMQNCIMISNITCERWRDFCNMVIREKL